MTSFLGTNQCLTSSSEYLKYTLNCLVHDFRVLEVSIQELSDLRGVFLFHGSQSEGLGVVRQLVELLLALDGLFGT